MPRLARHRLERGCFHVLNQGNHRFEIKLWGYCLMNNHWHIVMEVEQIEELSGWVHWICNRHGKRGQASLAI